jgi:nitrogen fixation protein FixH
VKFCQDRPDKWIPWYIVLFFVVLSFVFGGFTYVALKTHTGLVTNDPYKKGLAYNDIIGADRQQAALGYQPQLRARGGTAIFTLHDRTGSAVEITAASVWFFRPTDAKGDMRAEMTQDPARPHEYHAKPPAAGLWEVRVLAETPAGPYQHTKRMVFE